jgi:hypothetical protein
LDFTVNCEFASSISYRANVERLPEIVRDTLEKTGDAEADRVCELFSRFCGQHLANATELQMRRHAQRLVTGDLDIDDFTLSELCYSMLLLLPPLYDVLCPVAPAFELRSGEVVVWVSFAESDFREAEQVEYYVFVSERLAYRVVVSRRRAMFGKRLEREDLSPGWQERIAAIHRSLLTEAFKLNEELEYRLEHE